MKPVQSFAPFFATALLTMLMVPLAPSLKFEAGSVPVIVFAPEQPAFANKSEMARLKKSGKRWIQINLTTQRLIAWEGKTWVDAKVISSGKDATPTLTGVFAVQEKFRSVTMRGADYTVPDVPHAMFYDGNYAIHGAYWHNSFGTPVSHGCVNLSENAAAWLFDWAKVGTPIVIHY